MKRRAMVSTLCATAGVLAGCLNSGDETTDAAPGGQAPRSVVAPFDGGPRRPTCRREPERIEVDISGEVREFETVGTVAYPPPPSAFTEDVLVDYVIAFEEAYITQDILCNRYQAPNSHVFSIGYSVRKVTTTTQENSVTKIALLRSGAATEVSDGNGIAVTEITFSGVAFAVDETGLARATFDTVSDRSADLEAAAPDPLADGTLVAQFD